MDDDEQQPSQPFGTVYFGVIVAVIGLLITATSTVALGPVVAISGAMLICTGLVLRAIARIGY